MIEKDILSIIFGVNNFKRYYICKWNKNVFPNFSLDTPYLQQYQNDDDILNILMIFDIFIGFLLFKTWNREGIKRTLRILKEYLACLF